VQVWVPCPDEDGGVVLNTQGMPFSINGCGDLLALFRCISCKYKFSTDTTKTWIMGPVGRVYVTGEPELTHNVQEYEPNVYCRVVEARRCQVNSSLFLPIYTTPERDRVAAVMEVIQTECNAQTMRGLLDWARACLLRENLWTTMVDRDALPLGLRDFQGVQVQASAFESKIEPRSKDSVLPSSGAMPGTVSAPLQYSSQTVPGNTNVPLVPAAGTVTTVTTAPNYPSGCEVVVRKLNPLSPSKLPLVLAPDLCANLENEDSAPPSLGGKQIGLASSCLPPAKIVQVGRRLVLESNLDQNQSMMVTLHESPLADSVKEANVNERRSIGKVCHKSLTMNDISPLFCFSLREAATRIGVCETTLKKTCRKLGLKKWPRQQITGEKLARANSGGDGMQRNSGTTWSTDTSGSVGQPERASNGQHRVIENLPTVIPPLLPMPKTIFDAAGGIFDPGNLEDSLPKDCRLDLHNWQPIDMHSLESLDILAAGDVEISVGNGPEYARGSFQGLE
jgi:hypothetical protein